MSLKDSLNLSNIYSVIPNFQVWRLFTQLTFFTSVTESFIGIFLIYKFRVIERRLGSRKFSVRQINPKTPQSQPNTNNNKQKLIDLTITTRASYSLYTPSQSYSNLHFKWYYPSCLWCQAPMVSSSHPLCSSAKSHTLSNSHCFAYHSMTRQFFTPSDCRSVLTFSFILSLCWDWCYSFWHYTFPIHFLKRSEVFSLASSIAVSCSACTTFDYQAP